MFHIKESEMHLYKSLYSKNVLNSMGLRLKKNAEPVAYTYNRMAHKYFLYDIADTIPKRKCSEEQLKQLEKARIKSRTCVRCKFEYSSYHCLNEFKICEHCYKEMENKFNKVAEPFLDLLQKIDMDKAFEFMRVHETDIESIEGIFLFKNELKFRKEYYIDYIF